MTARYFCDICTAEVENPQTQPKFRTTVVLTDPPEGHTERRELGIQIMRAPDGAWNGGHVCNGCLRAALKQVCALLKDGAR